MNKVMLTGRLTKDPEVRYSQNQMCIARFTLAVDRRKKREEGQNADFPSCVAFDKTGEFAEKYARKGMKFDIVGHIQTGSYKKENGDTVYTTEVIVEDMEFGESKKSQEEADNTPKAKEDDGFMNVPEDDLEGLPFN